MKYLAPILVLFALISLNDPGGHKVYVARDQVLSVTGPGGCERNAGAKINLGVTFQCVQETVDQVVMKLQASAP